jgi:hypothetical protein
MLLNLSFILEMISHRASLSVRIDFLATGFGRTPPSSPPKTDTPVKLQTSVHFAHRILLQMRIGPVSTSSVFPDLSADVGGI